VAPGRFVLIGNQQDGNSGGYALQGNTLAFPQRLGRCLRNRRASAMLEAWEASAQPSVEKIASQASI